MTAETISGQPAASKPSIATGVPSPSVPTEASPCNQQLTPFDESKIRVAIASKTFAVITVLVFSVFSPKAEAGCGTESKRYVQQTPNISAQALPCIGEQESDVQGELVLPKPNRLADDHERHFLPEPNIHSPVEVSNYRPQDDAIANQSPKESATADVREFVKDHWGKGLSIFSLMLLLFRETLRAGSILSASGTLLG